ncbi:uncharacterized protein RHO17_021959 isoform 2-T3 [Thomomys bottae]
MGQWEAGRPGWAGLRLRPRGLAAQALASSASPSSARFLEVNCPGAARAPERTRSRGQLLAKGFPVKNHQLEGEEIQKSRGWKR